MTKAMSSEGAAALKSGGVELAMFVHAEFSGGDLRVNTTRSDIEDLESPANVYRGVGLIAGVDELRDSAKEVSSVSITVSGLDPGVLAIALGKQVRGRPIRIYLGVLRASDLRLLDLVDVWAGQMSTMPIREEGGTVAITLTAEHRGVLFARPKPVRYTDSDQQRLYPGDRCLEYIVSQSQAQDQWPAASFFRK